MRRALTELTARLGRRWQGLLRDRADALMNLYPPYLGAGVRVRRTADGKGYDVSMPLRWFNRNIVGTHFGGSLYAMTDPFFMAILMERLGSEHIVWDKAAEIRFRRPGRGTVRATFAIEPAVIEEIRAEASKGAPVERWFDAKVMDGDIVVAEVRKLLYVRLKG